MGPENKEFPTFSDPQIFFTQIEEQVELGPLANFGQFWYSRTFLKKFPKVENRAKKFFTSVGVSLQVRSMQLISTHLSGSRIDGNFLDRIWGSEKVGNSLFSGPKKQSHQIGNKKVSNRRSFLKKHDESTIEDFSRTF